MTDVVFCLPFLSILFNGAKKKEPRIVVRDSLISCVLAVGQLTTNFAL